MADDDVVIDPWGSAQSTDYDRIISQFGLSSMESVTLDNPSRLHRRGIVFAHRDLNQVLDAQRRGDGFGVLTGLMPSGQMHMGHSMVIDQVKWFQQQGGDVTIAVADLESQATTGRVLGKRAVNHRPCSNTLPTMLRLGLDVERTNVYFQSSQDPSFNGSVSNLGKRTNLNEFEAIYGFGGETNLSACSGPHGPSRRHLTSTDG